MRKTLICLAAALLSGMALAQNSETINRVEPPFWWTGMKHEQLQLLVHGPGIANAEVKLSYPGVTLAEVHNADNPDFLFLDLQIAAHAQPGSFAIEFLTDGKSGAAYTYELKERETDRWAHRGLDESDVIYLITPDRFANGNPENDEVEGLKEGKNREYYNGRHGGDIQGISSKIDYLDDLGATALWLNPVLENDMPKDSYHGYATTDYYKVDPRYGSNEEYKKLADDLHAREMKLIMDMVFNHCGADHWWMEDMPFRDWIHNYPDIKITNHAIGAVSDPYVAESDLRHMETGWFVTAMPDLNHDNPFMATYLIQNSIWWIEYAGLDGIRMDTYPYNQKDFMAEWALRVYEEYPDFYIVGETWVDNEAQVAYWSGKGGKDDAGYDSRLNSITDFPLCNAMRKAFGEDGDVLELYKTLTKDFLYRKPGRNKIFADNHDMDRFFHTIGGDLDKFKMAMTFLLTTRGIPQIYYGSEILMRGHGEHGVLREDFPGGWATDKRNAFTEGGRTEKEQEAFNYVKKLLNWRKNSDIPSTGTLTHFVPYDNVYVYNRKTTDESLLVIINNNPESKTLDMSRFEEALTGYESGKDIVTSEQYTNLTMLEIAPNTAAALELQPKLKSEIEQ